MCARIGIRWFTFVAVLATPGLLVAQPAPPATFKLAFFNIQSGKGEVGFPGRPVLFGDTQNCTDTTQPVNAWGVGVVQNALAPVRNDPSVIALGLAEAWICGSAENVRQTLGWAAKSATNNGVAVVARYGFAGPQSWQQLDTSLNPTPNDTMWVVRAPVCVDAACSRSMIVYAAHWYGTSTHKKTMYDRQAQQTVDFMRQTAGSEPHVLIGDLNAWEGTTAQCGQNPINAGVPKLRAAGYIDAWPRIHGTAEGFTGMTNRNGCGSPAGYTWKRIDYAWSSAGLEPLDMTRFAMPEVPGDAAPSDHYGIITTYPLPGGAPEPDTTAPTVSVVSPGHGATVSGTVNISVAAADNVGVTRVDVLEDGVVRHTLAPGASTVACDTNSLSDGAHSVQARAYDAAGNATTSTAHALEVDNVIVPDDPGGPTADIVLYARRASTLAGGWQVVQDPTAAGGANVTHPNAGAAKLASPLAQPAHYFELTFRPEAGRAYRLWIRGRAERNNWANDSVFVQFSGSKTSTGAPAFRIGTTSATTVNLEDAANVGVSGWGWQDNGYGVNVLGTLIHFDGSEQTLRVQTREDGMSIDQIVLSPVTYLTTAPGLLFRDATILAETAATGPPVSRAEIVLRASTPATYAGGWRVVSDATAADGVALTHPDAGGAKLAAALAAPVNYVDITFDAEAGRAYRLWIRGRADRNYWANDSVFVQFSGAVDATGAAAYQIGTTQSTTVNLEDAANAGVAGWGWQDNGYGTGVLGPLVTFAASGPQTIRIQTREDGFRFDQILLSSGTYLTAAPGPLKNDTTIVQ